MAPLLDMLIFDAVYGSWILSLLLFTLDGTISRNVMTVLLESFAIINIQPGAHKRPRAQRSVFNITLFGTPLIVLKRHQSP